jgi:hypothetical protein
LLGEDTPLYNWDAIRDQLQRAQRRDFNFNFPYRLITPIDPIYFPRQADDMIYTSGIYISINGLVYEVSLNPETLPLAGAVLTTLEFDEAQVQKLRSLDIFQGDEKDMVAELVKAWTTPTPPPPTPTPTPTVLATVTPSAFESPLVNGLKRYQGYSSYGYPDMPPYELWYDPTLWQLSINGDGLDLLVHKNLASCEINPHYARFEALSLAPARLADRDWGISLAGTNALGYFVGWGGGGYGFSVTLPEPIADPYDAHFKDQCQLDAETVFDTFNVLAPAEKGVLPTITPTPAP